MEKEIENFTKYINTNYKLNNFKKNKKKLNIKFDPNIDHPGLYNDVNNLIVLRDSNPYTLIHELFHASSHIGHRTGFYLPLSPSTFIGESINEGYTDLLTERYFNEKFMGYEYEKKIVLNLEKLIGKKQMNEFYFKGRCDKLIHSLMKYDTFTNIIYFLDLCDLYTMDHEDTSYLINEFLEKWNIIYNQRKDDLLCKRFVKSLR